MRIDTLKKGVVASTARIEVETPGDPWYGTVFAYSSRGFDRRDPQAAYLVTCRHVIEGGQRAHICFHRHAGPGENDIAVGNPIRVTVDALSEKWSFHPNEEVDIAVAPLSGIIPNVLSGGLPYILPLDLGVVPTADELGKLDVIEEVLFVGYPAGYYDRLNLMPVTRQGITASPLQFDYNGRPEFLVDGAVYFGSSGGPVFLVRTGIFVENGQLHVGSGNKFMLLGVISEVLRTTFDGEVGFIHPAATSEGIAVARLLNLGVVLKAHLIEEAIDSHLKNTA